MHFENLWDNAEQSFANDLELSSEDIIKKIIIKFQMLEASCKNLQHSGEELQKIKLHIIGEIMLDIAHLSAKDNINVYQALAESLQYRLNSIKY